MKHLTIIISFIVILAVNFSSCDSFDNKEALVREKYSKQITQESKGAIEMSDFQKTDGAQGEEGRMPSYKMDFAFTITNTRDCYKWANPLGFYNTFDVQEESSNSPNQYILKKGFKTRLYGTAYFEKHESGWILNRTNLTRSENI